MSIEWSEFNQRQAGIVTDPWDKPPMDMLEACLVIDGEHEGDEVEAYALLIRMGLGRQFSLQGRIMRGAADLVHAGVIDIDGNIIGNLEDQS